MAEYIEREAVLKEIQSFLDVISPSMIGKAEDLIAMDDKLLEAFYSVSAKEIPALLMSHVTSDRLIDLINDIPTSDVVPVVHAHWKQTHNGKWRCSACRGRQNHPMRFCGECGARMNEQKMDLKEGGGDDV